MHIRRFEAETLPEALRQVRESLGPDALVLETRKVGRGRLRFGMAARSRVEVVAASERAAPPVADIQAGSLRDAVPAPDAGARRAPDASWNGLRLSRALVAPLEEELRALRQLLERGLQRQRPAGPAVGEIAEELAEIRSLARELRGERLPPAAAALVSAGLAPRHARRLAGELSALGSNGTLDTRELVACLGRHLESQTRPPRCDESGPLMLVGATGVGKTTTLAKLAAGAGALPHALVSTDVLRLGADESLQCVAETLGMPFERADGPGRLARLVRLHGAAPILVDTSGAGRHDSDARDELLRLREGLGPAGRVQVVLSATTKEADLRDELARFADLEPEGCIVTRVDESADLANVANVLLDDDTPPLTWIGNGRCIPDDLEPADPRELARGLVGAAA